MDSYLRLYFQPEIIMPSDENNSDGLNQESPGHTNSVMRTLSNIFAIILSLGSLCAGIASVDAATTNVLKYEEPKHLVGTIYSADRKKALFKFSILYQFAVFGALVVDRFL